MSVYDKDEEQAFLGGDGAPRSPRRGGASRTVFARSTLIKLCAVVGGLIFLFTLISFRSGSSDRVSSTVTAPAKGQGSNNFAGTVTEFKVPTTSEETSSDKKIPHIPDFGAPDAGVDTKPEAQKEDDLDSKLDLLAELMNNTAQAAGSEQGTSADVKLVEGEKAEEHAKPKKIRPSLTIEDIMKESARQHGENLDGSKIEDVNEIPKEDAPKPDKIIDHQDLSNLPDTPKEDLPERPTDEDIRKLEELLKLEQKPEKEEDKEEWDGKIYSVTKQAEIDELKKKRTLDIVFSYYEEPLDELATRIRELKELEPLKGLKKTQMIIYCKNDKANLDEIKEKTGADSVVLLPNKGREGGTYLSHIKLYWNKFADHTMFLQANPHMFPEVKNRILDYYHPNTGVLSLGYTHQICGCSHCADFWDGERTFPQIPQLWSSINGELCPGGADGGILMGYGGQMIVSRNHVLGTSRHIFDHLQEVLESEKDHWIHSEPRQDALFDDVIDNPYFGHTLERSWMTVFKCADKRLHFTCREIGWRREQNDPDDRCQCMDDKLPQ